MQLVGKVLSSTPIILNATGISKQAGNIHRSIEQLVPKTHLQIAKFHEPIAGLHSSINGRMVASYRPNVHTTKVAVRASFITTAQYSKSLISVLSQNYTPVNWIRPRHAFWWRILIAEHTVITFLLKRKDSKVLRSSSDPEHRKRTAIFVQLARIFELVS